MPSQRLELLALPHGVYLLLDDEVQWTRAGGSPWVVPDTMEPGPGRLVHVMRPGHGEIRAYVLAGRHLHVRGPCYTGRWPAVDRAVAQRLNAEVVPYAVLPGGSVVAA